MQPTFNLPGFGWWPMVYSTIVAVLFIILHLVLMKCVWADGQRLRLGGRTTVVLTPFAWALAALMRGLLGVAFYWLAHYSSFVRKD